ncbi:GNAT family N-acetyltransferase [Rhodoblastus sp.]|uniref:GNAT family N-acetyltransferase n=1 Tax=Rhodoblastus sp. TaxID=1962975 RepID=UPI0035AECCAB
MGASRIENFREKLFPQGHCLTERLFIQPLQPADAFQLVVLTNDPLVAAGKSKLPQPFTLADAQDLIALPHQSKGCFASVHAGENGPFVGCVGAVVRGAADIEMGFWVGAPYHGKRYGAEAAEAMLGLLRDAFPDRRIVAECSRENGATWRLLQRLGFSPSGGSGASKRSQLLIFEAPAPVD